MSGFSEPCASSARTGRLPGRKGECVRRGLTLVELLVVLAIVAALTGLLLPAVLQAREAANRTRCANNLRQLGLALSRFHDARGKFPPGQVQGPYPEGGVYQAVNHGWAVFVLPYLEQQALSDLYHWERRLSDPANQSVVARSLAVFQCPSAPEPNRYYTSGPFATAGSKGACGDYAPAWSVDPTLTAGDCRGVLVSNAMTPLSAVTDGASGTILLAEDAGRPRLWQARQAGSDQTVSGGPWAGFDTGITLKDPTLNPSSRPAPCTLNCGNDHEVYSFHSGGAQVVFADGSVHFLRTGISLRVLAALITRAGGELVSAADY